MAEELASSYERKLIEVRLAAASVRLLPALAALGDVVETGPASYTRTC